MRPVLRSIPGAGQPVSPQRIVLDTGSGLAYRTQSLLPGIVLHALFNLVACLILFLTYGLPVGSDIEAVLADLANLYQGRGVNLVRVAGKWTFRTALDLRHLLVRDAPEPQRLSRAAMETLAIIAYHQPATRAEIEEIRGVSLSKGTLDLLLETGWVRLRGRRRSPGRPVTYGTAPGFLEHFGLDSVSDLPGLEELKGLGLFEGRIPPGLDVPAPSDDPDLTDEEDPLETNLSLSPEPDAD